MLIDPDNKIIQKCAEGMEAEGLGNPVLAQKTFQDAWDNARSDFERFIVAHYRARNQANTLEELKWNLESLRYAELVQEDGMQVYFPSLHLCAGKSYEKLNDAENALVQYKSAAGYVEFLPDDGYGNMIRNGIAAALKRCLDLNISVSTDPK